MQTCKWCTNSEMDTNHTRAKNGSREWSCLRTLSSLLVIPMSVFYGGCTRLEQGLPSITITLHWQVWRRRCCCHTLQCRQQHLLYAHVGAPMYLYQNIQCSNKKKDYIMTQQILPLGMPKKEPKIPLYGDRPPNQAIIRSNRDNNITMDVVVVNIQVVVDRFAVRRPWVNCMCYSLDDLSCRPVSNTLAFSLLTECYNLKMTTALFSLAVLHVNHMLCLQDLCGGPKIGQSKSMAKCKAK